MVVCGSKQQEPYVPRSIKVEPLTLGKGHAVFYIWRRARSTSSIPKLPLCPHVPPPTFLPFSVATIVEQGPNTKCMRGEASSSVQFPNYQPERLLGLMCYRHQIIFQMGKVHSPQMEGEKNIPITSLSKPFQACNFKPGGPGLIVLYILTFWPVN